MALCVVSDDQGRYVIPDLPQANYRVWVRGYGLVDHVVSRLAEIRPDPPTRAIGLGLGRRDDRATS